MRLFILFLFFCNPLFSQDWVIEDILDDVKVSFPSNPQQYQTSNETIYSLESEIAFYNVIVRQFNNDQVKTIESTSLNEFYDGFIKGALAASNGELVNKSEIFIDGHQGVEIEYNTELLAGKVFKRIIYLEPYILLQEFRPIQKTLELKDNRIRFFNSLKINSSLKPQETNDANVSNSSYTIGYFVGISLGILLILGFFVGLILLIKYMIKRKNRNQNIPLKKVSLKETFKSKEKMLCKKCQGENDAIQKYCSSCGFEL